MGDKQKIKQRQFVLIIKSILLILVSAFIAIVIHNIMPSPGATINVEDFNSKLVQMLGFPAVATLYFILIYVHICFVVLYFNKQSIMETRKVGIRFGMVFAFMYLVGMQEIMLISSPFESWGIDYVLYQLCIGLGDAIPAFLLCYFIFSKKERIKLVGCSCNKLTTKLITKRNVVRILLITVFVVAERVVGYSTGFIDNELYNEPVPVIIWTIMFGLFWGIAYCLIRPIIINSRNEKRKQVVSIVHICFTTIGLNWIIFNSFIGMIFANTIIAILLRGVTDVITLLIAAIFIERILKNKIEVNSYEKDCHL